MFRRRRRDEEPEPVDPVDLAALDPRWRGWVEEAIASRARFRELVARVGDGPLRERLTALADRVDEAVLSAWTTAGQSQAAERTLDTLRPEQVAAELKDARRRGAPESEVAALAANHASVNRLLNSLDAAAERLRLLDLQLDGAVARAAELVLRPAAVAELGDVDRELGEAVAGLDAFRAGLDAMGG